MAKTNGRTQRNQNPQSERMFYSQREMASSRHNHDISMGVRKRKLKALKKKLSKAQKRKRTPKQNERAEREYKHLQKKGTTGSICGCGSIGGCVSLIPDFSTRESDYLPKK